jgi:hypothetical protein
MCYLSTYFTYVRLVAEFPPNSSKLEFPPICQNWVPAERYSTKHVAEFPPISSKMEFPSICQNWVPAERYSTKNTNQNTNHQVPMPVTYQYQPNSQYLGKLLPLPPHLPTLPHAHMVFCLRNAPDIDAVDHDELISFVNRNFVAKLPRF